MVRSHRLGGPPTRVVARRGSLRDAQENSLAAFDAALRAGADGVSVDVATTLDGELLCFCDRPEVRVRLLDLPEPALCERELEALRDVVLRREVRYPSGSCDYAAAEPIPRLVDALALLPPRASVVLHLPPAAPHLPSAAAFRVAGKVADLLLRLGLQDRAIITSSDALALHRARRASRGRARTAFQWDDVVPLVGAWLGRAAEPQPGASGATARFGRVFDRIKASSAARRLLGSVGAAAIEFTALDGALLRELRAQGALVGTYTVFPSELHGVDHGLDATLQARILARLVDAGLDWVETDDPSRARAVIDRGWTASVLPV